jgi:hypothetical protein
MKYAAAVLLGLVSIESSTAELVQCPYGHYHEHHDHHNEQKQFGIPTEETEETIAYD